MEGTPMPLLTGIILGFLLAIPPGSIVIVGLNLTMTIGWRRASLYAVGTMIPDIGYALIALQASDRVRNVLRYSAAQLPLLVISVQGAMVGGLLLYGMLLIFRRSPLLTWNTEGTSQTGPRADFLARRGPFLLGLGLNASNIVSPTFLAALAIIVSQAHMLQLLDGSILNSVLYAAGFGIGNVLYLTLVMRLLGKALRRLNRTRLLITQKITGGILAGLAIAMGVQFMFTGPV
jgi:threonine/homoserine/homoserine lactone efflux protein